MFNHCTIKPFWLFVMIYNLIFRIFLTTYYLFSSNQGLLNMYNDVIGKLNIIAKWFIVLVEWNTDGSPQIAKEIMEVIDNENYITNYKVIEGNLLELYKSFSSSVKVTPKENDDGSLVHWIFEYEKLNEDVPDPTGKLQILIDVAKDIDAHLLSQQP